MSWTLFAQIGMLMILAAILTNTVINNVNENKQKLDIKR